MSARRPGFPKTLLDFQRRFATEEACEAYLVECRWPDGFACPRCGHGSAWPLPARRLRECAACGYQASTTAGTILHRTRTPLMVWFWAAYLMITDKRGFSALALQRQLGIARYETAWMILHKLRRATVNTSRTKLRGTVEVDEAWIGGVQPGGTGRTRSGRNAALAVLALEVSDGHPGRLRAGLVPDDTAASLVGFVQEVVEVGSTVITDGWPGYLALPEAGFIHERIVEGSGGSFVNPVPNLHHTVGNLKAWINGTHRGVSRHHLPVYLDEFAFRHNRRLNLAAAFQTLLGLGTTREATTYATITGAKDIPRIIFTPSRKETGKADAAQEVRAGGACPCPDADLGADDPGGSLTTTSCGHRRQPDRHIRAIGAVEEQRHFAALACESSSDLPVVASTPISAKATFWERWRIAAAKCCSTAGATHWRSSTSGSAPRGSSCRSACACGEAGQHRVTDRSRAGARHPHGSAGVAVPRAFGHSHGTGAGGALRNLSVRTAQ
jgi:transposase-like protein